MQFFLSAWDFDAILILKIVTHTDTSQLPYRGTGKNVIMEQTSTRVPALDTVVSVLET